MYKRASICKTKKSMKNAKINFLTPGGFSTKVEKREDKVEKTLSAGDGDEKTQKFQNLQKTSKCTKM